MQGDMRILTEPDMRQLEGAVRKVERMVRLNASRRIPVHTGISSGTFPIPTGRKIIPAATSSSAPDVYLTRDDRNLLLWWNVADVCDRYFYLPDDAEEGDTFWFCLKPNNFEANIVPGVLHAISAPVANTQEFDIATPDKNRVMGHFFNDTLGQYQRDALLFAPVDGSLTDLTWIIITFTGEETTVNDHYIDLNEDSYYTPGEPLVTGTRKLWSVLFYDKTYVDFPGYTPIWWSYDPWPTERH